MNRLTKSHDRSKRSPAKSLSRQRQRDPRASLLAHPLLYLQQTVGNQRTRRLLDEEASRRAGDLGEGQQLHGALRSHAESAYGADFSNVRIHTGGKASELTARLGTRAFTVGEDVVFGPGEYRPGTLIGDAVLAHELAHVAQQQGAQRQQAAVAGQQGGGYDALERDADRSALGLLASLWGGVRAQVGALRAGARPSLRTGLRLQSCTEARQFEPPAFLGAESRRTLATINRRLSSAAALQDMLVAGPLITLFTSSPAETAAGGGYPLEAQARAVAAVPAILRNRVLQDIDLLLVMHGNSLSPEERAYWNRIRQAFNQ